MKRATITFTALALLAGCNEPYHAHDHSVPHTHAYQVSAQSALNTHAIGIAAVPPADAAVEKAVHEMAAAANAFWASLSPELKTKSAFPFTDENRFDWHYIPRARKGVTWNDMSPEQKALARAFLASGLSTRGMQQAEAIMALEVILRDIENVGGNRRDPGNYAFSVFGMPGDKTTWGWRVEGHHISINLTMVNGRAVAGPVFFGTNPAEVRPAYNPSRLPDWAQKQGNYILAVEENLGRELVKSLSDDQKKIAIYNAIAPNEMITTNTRKANPGPPIGIKASALTAAQKKTLMTLIENYAYRLRPEIADQDLKKIETAGVDNIHFAWAGSVEPNQAHYYRIHGPSFLIEFDNAQNAANHIHTVWRDSTNDFGEDLLKQHYEKAKADAAHGHDH